MKNKITTALSLILCLVCIFSLGACNNKEIPDGLWQNAVYTEDTELGEGEKTIAVEFSVQDKLITFTVHTDAATVGEALIENDVISGENGAYGLYVKVVNGITADYDADQCYWSFYINGEYAMSGVDMTEIDESAVYRLEYAK